MTPPWHQNDEYHGGGGGGGVEKVNGPIISKTVFSEELSLYIRAGNRIKPVHLVNRNFYLS